MKSTLAIVGTAAVVAGALLTQAAPISDEMPMQARGLEAAARDAAVNSEVIYQRNEDQLTARGGFFERGLEEGLKLAPDVHALTEASTSGGTEALEQSLKGLHSGPSSPRLGSSNAHDGEQSLDDLLSEDHDQMFEPPKERTVKIDPSVKTEHERQVTKWPELPPGFRKPEPEDFKMNKKDASALLTRLKREHSVLGAKQRKVAFHTPWLRTQSNSIEAKQLNPGLHYATPEAHFADLRKQQYLKGVVSDAHDVFKQHSKKEDEILVANEELLAAKGKVDEAVETRFVRLRHRVPEDKRPTVADILAKMKAAGPKDPKAKSDD